LRAALRTGPQRSPTPQTYGVECCARNRLPDPEVVDAQVSRW
jgi:hypothetical protein